MPTTNVFVRLAQLADMPQLMALQERATNSMSTGRYSPDQIQYFMTHFGTVDVRMLADGEFYVVEIDDRIVGCGGWWPSESRPIADRLLMSEAMPEIVGVRTAVMRAIFIDREHRHQGMARRLVRTIRRAAQVRGLARFEVVVPAQIEGYFADLGFRTVERFQLTLPGGPGFPLVDMVMLDERTDRPALVANPPPAQASLAAE